MLKLGKNIDFNSLQQSLGKELLGLAPSAQALLVGQWAMGRTRPILVLCVNDEAAEIFIRDLRFFWNLMGEWNNLEAVLLPSWEHSPYTSISPSLRTRLDRIAALTRLRLEPFPHVLVSSVTAWSQATVSPNDLKQTIVTLENGSSLWQRGMLLEQLGEMGYQRVETVEDQGTFALRGDILDLYPPTESTPLRIEFFGDDIERIRSFNPQTQRTHDEVQKLNFGPAREVLLNNHTRDHARTTIKEFADNRGIQRKARDPIMEAIRNGQYPDRCDSWAPFVYQTCSSIEDYLPKECFNVLSDELACIQAADLLMRESSELFAQTIEENLITPSPEQLFPRAQDFEQSVKEKFNVIFNRIQIHQTLESPTADGPPPEDQELSGHFDIKTNQDLKSATKDSLGELEERFSLWREKEFLTVVSATTDSQLERIKFLLNGRGIECQIGPLKDGDPSKVTLVRGDLSGGFRWPELKFSIIAEHEFFGSKSRTPARSSGKKRKHSHLGEDWGEVSALSDLNEGDLVVHYDHGIGRYKGINRIKHSGASEDFIQLEYASGDKLYLPVYRLDLISKYIGGHQSAHLDKLGGNQFEKTKEKVKLGLKKLAINLVELYARRELQRGLILPEPDPNFREFEGKFNFNETPDQLKSIDSVLDDIHSGKVMDRLICGDVGYGKTEVAMRAAFHVASNAYQVAVIVPTTVLACQHEESFRQRFKDYPLVIESLSRFKNSKDQKKTIAGLADGKVDIVIGTHRLLSKDVQFKNLGLIIVDEEHRFGVEHKEKLKTIKVNCHVLTLTATPIPRTLHMALSGLRDISLMTTPPVDRLPIRTFISKYEDHLVQRAIRFELARGGQVFFLHNRVQSIEKMASEIQELVPESKIGIAHGQMSEKELEKRMMSFYRKEFNILLCTTIIESGLDVPNANTILINRADTFGLAQLYQLRGRVGRSDQRAYAYLLVQNTANLTEDARRRLEVIQRFVELGSGFNVASHDLEIRGGGNLLGPQQSGNVAAVGLDLYTQILEETISEIKGSPSEKAQEIADPEIRTPFSCYLDEKYVPDTHQRLALYRKLAASKDDQELQKFEEEMLDRFGPIPLEAQNLLWIIRLKQRLKRLGIISLKVAEQRVTLLPGEQHNFDPLKAIALMAKHPGSFQITPQNKIMIQLEIGSLRDLFFKLEEFFSELLPSQ